MKRKAFNWKVRESIEFKVCGNSVSSDETDTCFVLKYSVFYIYTFLVLLAIFVHNIHD